MTRLAYRLYRLASWLRYRLPRHLTPAGMLLLFGLMFAATASFDMDRTIAYQAFALQFCLLTTALLMKRFFRGTFAATRHLPRFASVGHLFRYRIEVRNQSKQDYGELEVFEDLSDPRPSLNEFRRMLRPDDSARSFRIVRRRATRADFRRAIVSRANLGAMRAGGVGETTVEVWPLRRGALRFESLSIAQPEVLGLARGFRRVTVTGTVLVLPKRYPLPAVALDGLRQYQPGGVALAAAVGESEEFVSLRDYRPGDPLRHIHWRSWARMSRPIVREYQDEFIPRHALILDTFARAAQDEAFEEAVSVAASFACTVDTQESLLDLLFVGAKAVRFTTGRGLGQVEQALEVLASVERQPDGSFEVLRRLVLQHASLVSGCICVFVTWDETRRELVRSLRAMGRPVLALVVGAGAGVGTSAGKSPGGKARSAETMAGVHFLEPGRIAEGLQRLEAT